MTIPAAPLVNAPNLPGAPNTASPPATDASDPLPADVFQPIVPAVDALIRLVSATKPGFVAPGEGGKGEEGAGNVAGGVRTEAIVREATVLAHLLAAQRTAALALPGGQYTDDQLGAMEREVDEEVMRVRGVLSRFAKGKVGRDGE